MLSILKIKTTYPSLLNPKAITPSSNEKALIKITNSLYQSTLAGSLLFGSYKSRTN